MGMLREAGRERKAISTGLASLIESSGEFARAMMRYMVQRVDQATEQPEATDRPTTLEWRVWDREER